MANVHQESPAHPLDPPFATHGTQPFPRPTQPRLHTTSGNVGISDQSLRSHATVAWENDPSIPPVGPQQYTDHTSGTLTPSNVTSTHTHHAHSAVASWPAVESGDSAVGTANFHPREEGQTWDLTQTHPDRNAPYAQHVQHQLPDSAPAMTMGPRRPSRKKNSKGSVFVRRETREVEGLKKKRAPAGEAEGEDSYYAKN